MSTGAIFPMLTDRGRALKAKIEQGSGTIALDITRITAGAGVSDDPLSQTEVMDERQEWKVTAKTTEGAMARITAQLTNAPNAPFPGIAEGYEVWQIGFYAIDPDIGEILYRILQLNVPIYMPATAEMVRTVTSAFIFTTHNASEVIIQVDPEGLASKGDLDHAIETHDESAEAHADLFAGKVPFVQDKDGVRVLRNVANKTFGDGIYDGTVKITIPPTPIYSDFNIKLRGYDRKIGAFEMILGGTGFDIYNNWIYNESAIFIGKAKIFDTVRFANDGYTACILLGRPDTRWLDLALSISEVTVSYNPTAVPLNGWDISLITSESGLTNIVEVPVEFAGILSGIFTPVIAGGTTAGNPTISNVWTLWQKIGKRTYIRFRLDITALGGASGNIMVQGFPFADIQTANGARAIIHRIDGLNYTVPAGEYLDVAIAGTYIYFYTRSIAADLPVTYLSAAHFSNPVHLDVEMEQLY